MFCKHKKKNCIIKNYRLMFLHENYKKKNNKRTDLNHALIAVRN